MSRRDDSCNDEAFRPDVLAFRFLRESGKLCSTVCRRTGVEHRAELECDALISYAANPQGQDEYISIEYCRWISANEMVGAAAVLIRLGPSEGYVTTSDQVANTRSMKQSWLDSY